MSYQYSQTSNHLVTERGTFCSNYVNVHTPERVHDISVLLLFSLLLLLKSASYSFLTTFHKNYELEILLKWSSLDAWTERRMLVIWNNNNKNANIFRYQLEKSLGVLYTKMKQKLYQGMLNHSILGWTFEN